MANKLPEYYSEYTENKPENYTDKLQTIVVLSIRKHYESFYNKKTGKSGHKNFTYVYYKTKENSYYPARNGGYLDGLVGCTKLAEFNRTFTQTK
jgi:hypothetical protein